MVAQIMITLTIKCVEFQEHGTAGWVGVALDPHYHLCCPGSCCHGLPHPVTLKKKCTCVFQNLSKNNGGGVTHLVPHFHRGGLTPSLPFKIKLKMFLFLNFII